MSTPKPKGLSAPARLHLEQRRQLLKEHPHLRSLSGPQPLQLVAVLALLAARWGLAYLLQDASLVLIGVAACTLGVWLVHALGTYVHEQGHRLIVQSEPWATAVDVLIEVGITSFGTGTSYQWKHVNFHHRYLGDYEWDSEIRDLCGHVSVVRADETAWLASRGLQLFEAVLAMLPLGGLFAQDAAVGLRAALLAPDTAASDATRASRFAPPPAVVRKQRALAALSVACHVAAWSLWGWRAALFSLWSVGVKSSRFDVVGWGQDMAEHNVDDALHPTNSTYTVWNWLFCNTGYHNEHHTFPNVPGCYLPRITAASPHTFGACENHVSWPALWAMWARSGFRSFRLSPYMVEAEKAGRCDRRARPKEA